MQSELEKIMKPTHTARSILNERSPIQLTSRDGELQNIDLFAPGTWNYSAVVVGTAGSGRSSFVKDLTLGYLSRGAKIWQIEGGRGYDKLCELLGGEYVSLTTDGSVCINPFSSIVDVAPDMSVITSIIAQMASLEVADEQGRRFVEEAVGNVYARCGSDANVGMVGEYLCQQHKDVPKKIGEALFAYSADGIYGKLFNGASNLPGKSKYTVYDLSGLGPRGPIWDVVLLTLLHHIKYNMSLDMRTPKLAIVDEAFDLFSERNTHAARVVEGFLRRSRSFGGGLVTVTISIDDFSHFPAGNSILVNSSHVFILRQRFEDVQKIQSLPIDDHMRELISSVHMVPGKYAEVFYYPPDGKYSIGRLTFDRFKQLLFSTYPKDIAKIQEHTNAGMSLPHAIRRVEAEESMGRVG